MSNPLEAYKVGDRLMLGISGTVKPDPWGGANYLLTDDAAVLGGDELSGATILRVEAAPAEAPSFRVGDIVADDDGDVYRVTNDVVSQFLLVYTTEPTDDDGCYEKFNPESGEYEESQVGVRYAYCDLPGPVTIIARGAMAK